MTLVTIKGKGKLIAGLNKALALELRAYAMYAHYAAYLKGLEGLSLKSHFEEEAKESVGHAKQIRELIALLDGEAVTLRNEAPIVHTEDYRVMLEESLKAETTAAKHYRKLVPLGKEHPGITHTLTHVLMDELGAVEDVEALLAR